MASGEFYIRQRAAALMMWNGMSATDAVKQARAEWAQWEQTERELEEALAQEPQP